MGIKMRRKLSVLLALSVLFVTLGACKVDAATKVKEVNLSVEVGKTITFKDLKQAKVKGNIKVSNTSKGLQLKGTKEGVSTFTAKNKKYNIVTLNSVKGIKFDKVTVKKTSGVFYVVRKFNTDAIVTVLNTNNYDADVTYTRKEFKEKNVFFEKRDQKVTALGKNETFSFFSYESMPIYKDSITVKKSKYHSLDSKDVKLITSLNTAQNMSCVTINNNTNKTIYVDGLILKYGKSGNMIATDIMNDVKVDKTYNFFSRNYTTDIKNMDLADYHLYVK